METGVLQRKWAEVQPLVYDKETRYVCMDIKPEQMTDEEGHVINGYSFFQVEIDSLMDYGHIKSQLIEAGFAQKDEFGLLMNAVDGVVEAAKNANSWSAFKEGLNMADVTKFLGFCEYRAMCASAAHAVLDSFNRE